MALACLFCLILIAILEFDLSHDRVVVDAIASGTPEVVKEVVSTMLSMFTHQDKDAACVSIDVQNCFDIDH